MEHYIQKHQYHWWTEAQQLAGEFNVTVHSRAVRVPRALGLIRGVLSAAVTLW